jgi:prophage antirepressor-like protein
MTNTLQVFKNTEFGEIRTIQQGENILFVAADVCRALGLSNPSRAVARLDADERSNFKLGRQGEANVVNEYGLYNLVLSSRKPEAKAFKRWITHEVIPAIRKTGKYAVVSSSPARGGSKVKYYKGIAVITKKIWRQNLERKPQPYIITQLNRALWKREKIILR